MTSTPLLDTIQIPADLRELDRKQLPQLARELRDFLVDSVSQTGGHRHLSEGRRLANGGGPWRKDATPALYRQS